MKLNTKFQKKNAILSSLSGGAVQISNVVFSFVYRTCFLLVLSKEYLGINGLFSNILQVFSLAELGIGSVIAFRLYDPIKNKDIQHVSALMDFYKTAYHIICGIILVMGLIMLPFLNFFIADTSEIPADVNIRIVYILFVLQSAISYLFIYKQSIAIADQNGYVVSNYNIFLNLLTNSSKILILFLTENFTVTLFTGIVITVLSNYLFSRFITIRYKDVFSQQIKLNKSEKIGILKDTYAMLCHKIGSTVVFSSDNLILSKYIGIKILGIYSNYSLIISSLSTLISKMLSELTPGIGNINITATPEKKLEIYYRLSFLNMWIASFCTVTLWIMINPFIAVWQDETFLLDSIVVLILCVKFFIDTSRAINGTFINSCGLFVKDKIRPLIEVVINLTISIYLVKKIGIAGIFIGTIGSTVLTSWWREPYLLYRHIFKRPILEYAMSYAKWALSTGVTGVILHMICFNLPINIWGLIGRGGICAIGINLILIVINFKKIEYQYFKNIIAKTVRVHFHL